MRYILLLSLFTYLLASQKSCYTVQLVSAFKTPEAKETIEKKEYDSSCKIMEIGKSITVRCGCFEKSHEAFVELDAFTKEYKQAYVTTTYRSRFDVKEPEKKESLIVLEPSSESNSSKSLPKEEKQNILQGVAPKVEMIPSPKELRPPKKREEPKRVKKQKKDKKIEQKEKQKKRKAKRQKKKKKKKSKYVKKRDPITFYSRYLNKLESRKANKYGYKYRFGAQISYDGAYVSEADKEYVENDLRRIRVYHKGSLYHERLFYELEYSFTGANHYKDILLGYQDRFDALGFSYSLKMGNIKIPFSLETYTSSKNITFMERALSDAFADNRKLGVELLLSQDIDNSKFNFFTSLYANSIDEQKKNEVGKEGYALRATYAYAFGKRHLFSLGGAYMYRDMQGEDVKINQGAESKYVEKKYLSVKLKEVESTRKSNIEALYIYDKYYLGAEYTRMRLDAYNKLEYLHAYNFNAFYLEGSYFLKGRGKRYDFSASTLKKVKPKIGGAIELAFRYSYINLNDDSGEKVELGGEQTDYTYGVNWYVNRELKLMFNYIVSEPKGTKEYDGRLQIAQVRALFAF